MKKETMTPSKMGRIGGNETKRKYGKSFYQKIGKMGRKVVLAKHGPDFYLQLSRKGVEARLKKLALAKEIEST